MVHVSFVLRLGLFQLCPAYSGNERNIAPVLFCRFKSALQCVLWIIHTTFAHWSGFTCPPAWRVPFVLKLFAYIKCNICRRIKNALLLLQFCRNKTAYIVIHFSIRAKKRGGCPPLVQNHSKPEAVSVYCQHLPLSYSIHKAPREPRQHFTG